MEKQINYIQLPEISNSTPAPFEETMMIAQPTIQQKPYQTMPQTNPQNQMAIQVMYPQIHAPSMPTYMNMGQIQYPGMNPGILNHRVEPMQTPNYNVNHQQMRTPGQVPSMQHMQGVSMQPMQMPQMQSMQMPQAPMDYREHVVYAPQEIYKIQSRGTQFAVCPNCRKAVQTVVQFKAGAGTWATGAFILLSGCWLGCCLAPCYLDDCNDAIHFCPVCSKEIGRKTFLFKC